MRDSIRIRMVEGWRNPSEALNQILKEPLSNTNIVITRAASSSHSSESGSRREQLYVRFGVSSSMNWKTSFSCTTRHKIIAK